MNVWEFLENIPPNLLDLEAKWRSKISSTFDSID